MPKVIANLQALASHPQRKFMLGVGYVMTNRNTVNLANFMRQLDEIGVDYFYTRPVEEAPDIMPDFEVSLRR